MEKANLPLVSVIVPVFNVEPFLAQCLESILAQTYPSLEIILVNDGSTDGSFEICKSFAERDGRIILVNKTNGGLSDARNAGLAVFKGDYVCFVDSDDYVAPTYISRLFEAAYESDADISVCNFVPVLEDGSRAEKQFGEPVGNHIYEADDINDVFISEQNTTMVVAWNKLYKRHCFEQTRFKVGKLHEDEWTTYKLLYDASRIVTISEGLYFYLLRSGGSITSSRKKEGHYFDVYDAFFEQYLFACRKGNRALKRYSISRCISELKIITWTYDYDVIAKRVFSELRKILFLCPFYIRRYYSKAKLIYRIWKEKAECRTVRKKLSVIKRMGTEKKQHVVMLGTPSHNNLGDHAIAIAEQRYWLSHGLNGRVIEFQADALLQYHERIMNGLNSYSIATIDGGGNIGSLWPVEHNRIIGILSSCSPAKLVMFPETVTYTELDYERVFMRNDRSVFENANCLYMLRDHRSFEFFEKNLAKTKHVLVPDIVFSLKNSRSHKATNNRSIGLIFRSDKEKIQSDSDITALENRLESNGYNIVRLSTISNRGFISSEQRKKELSRLFSKIKKLDLVITDRLHGMIFSYINNVKCYALNNVNGKVKGSHEWLNHNPNYLVADKLDFSEIERLIQAPFVEMEPVDTSGMETAITEWIRISA